MRHRLQPHPDFPCTVVSGIEVSVAREKTGNLLVHYYVSGDPKQLVPTPWQNPSAQRRDELWQHSCFEAFIKPAGGEGYVEFNFAPTHDWQAYQLSGYRDGRHPIEQIAKPQMETRLMDDGHELRVILPLSGLLADVPWQLGLAAVIEDKDGAISYWALAHAPDKPDFHHANAFALQLPVTP